MGTRCSSSLLRSSRKGGTPTPSILRALSPITSSVASPARTTDTSWPTSREPLAAMCSGTEARVESSVPFVTMYSSFISPSSSGLYSLTLLDLGEGLFVDLVVLLAEEDEPDQTYALEPLFLFHHRPQRHLRGLLHRIAEDAGRDGREGDGVYPVLLGERERVAVAVGQ